MYKNTILIDTKYLMMLGARLDGFEAKSQDLWNCRCPICGDSQKDKTKKRGYFFPHKTSIMYKCHNCNASMGMTTFLKQYHPDLFQPYKLEAFKGTRDISIQPLAPVKKEAIPLKTSTDLICVSDMDENSDIKKYLSERKIPKEHYDKLFYTSEFKKFCNNMVPGTFKTTANDEPRLVIPFYDRSNKEFAWIGRSIDKENKQYKYITIKRDPNALLVYGLERVDPRKTIIAVEGPIDSLFLENCVAVSGSALSKLVKSEQDLVFAFDNEPRSKEITKLIKKVIKKNKKVVLWPEAIESKDINDMRLSGMSSSDILEVINKNTFQGAAAMLRFSTWAKV